MLASQKCREQRLLDALAQQSLKLTEFRALNLAALAWAFGVLMFPEQRVLADISAKSVPQIIAGDFDPHSIASIAWSFATLVYHDAEIFKVTVDAHWKPQDLANTAWAMTTMQIQPPSMMAQLAHESLQKLHLFRRDELEMLLWSLVPSEWDQALKIFHWADRRGRLRPLSDAVELNGNSGR